MTINEKCRKLPVLKTRTVEWGGGKKQPDGSITWPFPIYGPEVDEWIRLMYELELTDHDYMEHFEAIKAKSVEKMTRDEVLSYMTYLIRGERFCDGLIAGALRDGTLEALSVRLRQLTV